MHEHPWPKTAEALMRSRFAAVRDADAEWLLASARRATLRTIRLAPCRSRRRPSAVTKTGPSVRSLTARSIARAVRGASGMVTTLPPLRVMNASMSARRTANSGTARVRHQVVNLAQVQRIGFAGLTAVPGQVPGEREPLGVSEDGLDRDEDSGRSRGGHGYLPGSWLRPGELGQSRDPSINPIPAITRTTTNATHGQ